MTQPIFLVTAASGRIGSRVARGLLDGGQRVRVVARDGAHVGALTDRGAEPAIGDLRDPIFAERAFAGVDTAFLLVRADRAARDYRRDFGDVGGRMAASLAAARVRRAVFLSALGAHHDKHRGLLLIHRDVELALDKVTGTDVTCLRAPFFAENLLYFVDTMRERGGLYTPIDPEARSTSRRHRRSLRSRSISWAIQRPVHVSMSCARRSCHDARDRRGDRNAARPRVSRRQNDARQRRRPTRRRRRILRLRAPDERCMGDVLARTVGGEPGAAWTAATTRVDRLGAHDRATQVVMSIDVDVADLRDARARFLDLVRELRPELHRYCARMTGSVVDGEDVLQDTLVHGYFALAELDAIPALRPWLFRIAHNRAIDFLRRYDRRMREPRDLERERRRSPSAADVLDEQVAVRAALASFGELPPSQRACVILKDVLGHSSREIGEILELGVGAVEASLHRGRSRLRAIAQRGTGPLRPVPAPSMLVERYAVMFQARDWDGVRALLADDVELDLVGHSRRRGGCRRQVLYELWRTRPVPCRGWPAGRSGRAIRVRSSRRHDARLLHRDRVQGGSIGAIRDYRFVPYLFATPN